MPSSETELGFPSSFVRSWEGIDQRPSETRHFASWVLRDSCTWDEYWQDCSSITGDFFDPGVVAPLIDDVELVAVYEDLVEVSFRCGAPGDGSAEFASVLDVARFQRVDFPTIEQLYSSCGADGSGYSYLGTWQLHRSGSVDIMSGSVRPRSSVALEPDWDAAVMRFVLDVGAGEVSGGRGFPEFKQLAAGETLTAYNGTTYGEGTYYVEYQYPWTTGFMFGWTSIANDGYFADGNRSPWLSMEQYPAVAEGLSDTPGIFYVDHRAWALDVGIDWSENPFELVGVVYVQYDEKFWFECDPNGGDPYDGTSVTRSTDGLSGSRATGTAWWTTANATIACDVPTKAGWTFTGWNTRSDGSGTNYVNGAGVNGSQFAPGAHTLYAQWSQNSYPVTFWRVVDGAGTRISDSATEVGVGISVPELPAENARQGYEFAGWNTAQDGSGTTYSPGEAFVLDAAGGVDFWSLWEPLEQQVVFEANPGVGSTVPEGMPDPVVASTNSNATLPAADSAPERLGYTFTGWNTAEDGSGTAYVSGDPFPVGLSGGTLYAQWEPNVYQVVLYDSDGSNPRNVNSGAGDGTFDTEFRLQYAHTSEHPGRAISWNLQLDGSGESFVYDNSNYDYLPIDRTTIPDTGDEIALYQQVEWPVTYYWATAGGGTDFSAQWVLPGNSVTKSSNELSIAETPGWQFAGWDMGTDGEDVLYDYGAPFVLTAQALAASSRPAETFTAMYRPRNVKVTFRDGDTLVSDTVYVPYRDIGSDGEVSDPTSYRPNPTFTVPAAPEREGFEFKEWNTSPDGTGSGAAPGESFALPGAQDFVLHAVWKDPQTLNYSGPSEFQITDPFYAAIPLVDWDGTGQGNHVLNAASSADLDVSFDVRESSATICSLEESLAFDGATYRTDTTIRVLSLGTCSISMSQAGNSDVSSAEGEFAIDLVGIPRVIEVDERPAGTGIKNFWLSQSYVDADDVSRDTYDPITVTTSTPEICSITVIGRMLSAAKISGGTCEISIIQDGRDGTDSLTFFEPYESNFSTFFKFDQSVSFNEDGIVPFIAGVSDEVDLDISLEEGLEGNATWLAIEVDESWVGQADLVGGVPVPRTSTVCEVNDDEQTIRLRATGQCGIFGEISGNETFEDWSSFDVQPPVATGRFVVKEGFFITLDAGVGAVNTSSIISAEGMAITLPVPTLSGQSFVGWNIEADGSGRDYRAGEQEWSGNEGLTLHAQWEERAPILAADQSRPHAAVGSAAYVFPDGARTPTPLTITGLSRITAGESEFQMDLEGNEEGAAELDEASQTLFFRTGKEGIATGRGFMPGTLAEVWLFSEPTFLGETLVGPDGTFSKVFDVPEDIELGEHTIQAEGTASNGELKAVAAGVIIAGATEELPMSGGGSGQPASPEVPVDVPPSVEDPMGSESDLHSALPLTGATATGLEFALLILIAGLAVFSFRLWLPPRSPRGRSGTEAPPN